MRPLLLILDGHKTHYQPHVCQEAKKRKVIIFCLPPFYARIPAPGYMRVQAIKNRVG